LAISKKRVAITEMLNVLTNGMEPVNKNYLLRRLSKLGVFIFTNNKAEAFIAKGVIISAENYDSRY
jgi:NADH dehydrogenase FAD-containing subunit